MGFLREALESVADAIRDVGPGMFVLDLPTSMQLNNYSCGVECTYAVLQFFGVDVGRREVARLLKATKNGVGEEDIMRVLDGFGLRYRVMEEGTIEELDEEVREHRPTFVALDDDDHWAVVYGTCDDFIMLMDPSPSRMLQTSPTEEQLYERWSGWGIVVG